MDIVRVFALNVKKYRKEKNMSQEELAEKSNLHRTYISAIECYRRSISLENIQRIADALGVQTFTGYFNSTHEVNCVDTTEKHNRDNSYWRGGVNYDELHRDVVFKFVQK